MENEAAKATGVPWSQIATWIGLILSFIWNFVNYRRTSSVRQGSIKFDQFKEIRAPVDAALSLLREDLSTLRAMQASAADPMELRKIAEEAQRKVISHYNSLDTALGAMDESSFASGENWVEELSNPWDAFTNCFDRAYAPNKSSQQILTIISESEAKLRDLVGGVSRKLEREVTNHINA